MDSLLLALNKNCRLDDLCWGLLICSLQVAPSKTTRGTDYLQYQIKQDQHSAPEEVVCSAVSVPVAAPSTNRLLVCVCVCVFLFVLRLLSNCATWYGSSDHHSLAYAGSKFARLRCGFIVANAFCDLR
jgi:hypothetical protein